VLRLSFLQTYRKIGNTVSKETYKQKVERIEKFGMIEGEFLRTLVDDDLVSDPAALARVLEAQIKHLNFKNAIMTNSLERIATGMLSAGESRDEAQAGLLDSSSPRKWR
jgi:hypothetical protein